MAEHLCSVGRQVRMLVEWVQTPPHPPSPPTPTAALGPKLPFHPGAFVSPLWCEELRFVMRPETPASWLSPGLTPGRGRRPPGPGGTWWKGRLEGGEGETRNLSSWKLLHPYAHHHAVSSQSGRPGRRFPWQRVSRQPRERRGPGGKREEGKAQNTLKASEGAATARLTSHGREDGTEPRGRPLASTPRRAGALRRWDPLPHQPGSPQEKHPLLFIYLKINKSGQRVLVRLGHGSPGPAGRGWVGGTRRRACF